MSPVWRQCYMRCARFPRSHEKASAKSYTCQKSWAFMSGERGGHVTSPKREITRCGKERRNSAMLITAVWAVVPSCWNLQGTIVWWNIRGQKFIDHLCVKLRRDSVRTVRLGLRLTDTSTRAVLSGMWTEDGRPGGFLHVVGAFFTPLPYPSTDCIWRWRFLLIPWQQPIHGPRHHYRSFTSRDKAGLSWL
jgi:hypothetical protein